MEKLRFRSLAAVSLFALGVGCGQQGPAPGPSSEPVGYTSQGISTGLVISGVYGGGGGSTGTPTYNSDYVEIFNRGTTSLPLTGMSLQYAVASKFDPDAGVANPWVVIPLPSGATVPAGGYYLVKVFGPGSVGGALPTPDYDATGMETGTLQNYGTSSGVVALVSNTTAIDCGLDGGSCAGSIVDLMAYGDTCPCGSSARPPVYEGTAPAAAGVNTSGFFRKAEGCTETDDNKNDFELVAFSASVAPRNSASPVHLCSVDGGLPDAAVDVAVDAPADAPADSGTTDGGGGDAGDTGTAPTDTGTAPEDTGTAPEDTGTTTADTGTAAADTGTENVAPVAEEDDGCGCRVAGQSHESTMAGAFAALAIAGVLARRRRR